MCEVVMSNEGGIEMEAKGAEMETEAQIGLETEKNNKDGDGGGSTSAAASSSVVRWERFLPKMVVRVLLVEADDSTRQIITALLRKCSYRVAAVSDGLKAWEVLKGRPHNIDLILTEVDLPSISGFPLLTLIMEHEICKNIPVIMMSAQDSVNTVYKCMLRGAADFLVKPVRKNELRNLWQHVWRRQASGGGGPGPPDESVAQEKFEATAENNATSNLSSGYTACIRRNRECIDKGSDAQSSCTKKEMDTEGADEECTQGLSQPKGSKSLSNDMNVKQQDEVNKASQDLQMHDAQAMGSQAATAVDREITWREDMNIDDHWHQRNFITETPQSHDLASPPVEAIDLIGAFDNYLKCTFGSSGSNIGANKINYSPLLDLSLRRSHPSGSVNQDTDERPRLNHSDASAFSRYVNIALQSQPSTSPSTCNQRKGYETNSDKQLSNHTLDYNSDARAQTVSSLKHIHLASGQPWQAEIAYHRPVQKVLQAPVPERGKALENLSSVCGPVIPQIFIMQSNMLLEQSPGLTDHQQASFQANTFRPHPHDQAPRNPQHYNSLMEQNTKDATDRSENKQDHKLETLADHGHFSSATDQSPNNSFSNGGASHFHSISYGSNGKGNTFPVINDTRECPIQDANSHRSMQREAALNKFRMKRKERCYEKKVRYESRKKLAEQRPRVKGQFVRQAHNDAPPGSSAD